MYIPVSGAEVSPVDVGTASSVELSMPTEEKIIPLIGKQNTLCAVLSVKPYYSVWCPIYILIRIAIIAPRAIHIFLQVRDVRNSKHLYFYPSLFACASNCACRKYV